jgi:hypothetical protein
MLAALCSSINQIGASNQYFGATRYQPRRLSLLAMEYNFINPAFFVGLLGTIPWGTIFRSRIAAYFQIACLVVGSANLVYGLFVILT